MYIPSKTYYGNTLKRGKNLLNTVVQSRFPKTKYVGVALGNHNVADDDKEGNEGMVHKTEKATFTDPFRLYEAPATYVPYPCTNFLEYEFIFINTNLSVDSVVEGLKVCLEKCTTKFVYVVGHEPLIAAKLKNEEYWAKLKDANKIFDVLFENMKKEEREISYLCADVHNFQTLIVSRDGKTLPIIVCGTGGAEPDPIPEEVVMGKCYNIDDLKVKVKLIAKSQPYGYCLISGKNIVYRRTYNTIPNNNATRVQNYKYDSWAVKVEAVQQDSIVSGNPLVKIKK